MKPPDRSCNHCGAECLLVWIGGPERWEATCPLCGMYNIVYTGGEPDDSTGNSMETFCPHGRKAGTLCPHCTGIG